MDIVSSHNIAFEQVAQLMIFQQKSVSVFSIQPLVKICIVAETIPILYPETRYVGDSSKVVIVQCSHDCLADHIRSFANNRHSPRQLIERGVRDVCGYPLYVLQIIPVYGIYQVPIGVEESLHAVGMFIDRIHHLFDPVGSQQRLPSQKADGIDFNIVDSPNLRDPLKQPGKSRFVHFHSVVVADLIQCVAMLASSSALVGQE